MGARYLISSICDGFFAYLAVDLADSHHTSASDTHHSLPEAGQEAPRTCRNGHLHRFLFCDIPSVLASSRGLRLHSKILPAMQRSMLYRPQQFVRYFYQSPKLAADSQLLLSIAQDEHRE